MVWLVVILFGCQESVGKLKKKIFPNISYQSSPRTGYLSNFFILKNICYLVIWSWFEEKGDHDLRGKVIMIWGKGCVFQRGSKIVDLGFVKFKSNGTKAKRPLDRSRKHGAKKKHFFVCFFRGFCMDFPGKQMGDGFSWESNGDCTNLGIKRGLQQNKKIITWLD